jgi:hypothetical protein
VITYVAVDSKGARSAQAHAVVLLTVPSSAADPTKTKRRTRAALSVQAAATGTPGWDGPGERAWTCFGSGINSQCWFMLSVARTAQFNQDKSWTPSISGAAQLCLKYGILPMKNADCAKALLSAGINGLWDGAAIHNAAAFGSCLLYRVARYRTVRHPLAGVWGSPEYHPTESSVTPYNGNPSFTGWATWPKPGVTDIVTGAKWRIPLFCGTKGTVFRNPHLSLVTAP